MTGRQNDRYAGLNKAQIAIARNMSEITLQRMVIELAQRRHFLAFSLPDSRRVTERGFLDLTLCHRRTGRLIFAELKTETGQVSEEQADWLYALCQRGHVEAYVWRPRDWLSGLVDRTLALAPADYQRAVTPVMERKRIDD